MLNVIEMKKEIEENFPLLEQARKLLDEVIRSEQPRISYSEEQLALLESWDILCKRQMELMMRAR
ncbi:MAG: hypothetical protein WC667_06915 [Sulfurimonas sp.]|jgi:hypothetical protein